jgi:Sortase domain
MHIKFDKKYGVKTATLFLGAILVLLGIYSLNPWYRATQIEVETSKVLQVDTIVNESTKEPGETPIPVKDNEYLVPADQPRAIHIANLNIVSYIQKVGIDKEKRIAVPTNIHVAGWFTGSVKPGDPGLSIIDGHYGGRYSNGIFYDLHTLEPGNTFSVEFGDKSKRGFIVKTVVEVSKEQAQEILYKRDNSIVSQLNLITCGGEYDNQARTYNDRVIVVAESV